MTDEEYMNEAYAEALKSLETGDVPVGAVIVRGGDIIARGFNQVEKRGRATAHAEMIAIENAIADTGYKHLLDCTIYVTLEPCAMCSGAIVLSRMPRLVWGTADPKTGASGSLFTITSDTRLNHRCEVQGGVLAEKCSALISEFFKKLRSESANGR